MIVREGLQLYGRVCDCSAGFATVREGLRLCGRVCDCTGGFATVLEVATAREGFGRVDGLTGRV